MAKKGNITYSTYHKAWQSKYGPMHSTHIKLDNGDEGIVNHKEQFPAKLSVGKEIWYSLEQNDNGNKIKVEQAPQEQTQNQQRSYGKSPEEQLSIIRQSSLKVATDYYIAFGRSMDTPVSHSDIIKLSEIYVRYVQTGQMP